MFPSRIFGTVVMVVAIFALFLNGCEDAELSPIQSIGETTDEAGALLKDGALPSSVHADLARVREATALFHRVETAQAAGYGQVPGLDHCFNNPGVGGMGYHYINTGILDTLVDLLHPEAMVYHSRPNGQLTLGAVEYIVPAALWDPGHTGPPMVLGQDMHLNATLGVYVLHAWIWTHNPAGIFEDWNPRVTCP